MNTQEQALVRVGVALTPAEAEYLPAVGMDVARKRRDAVIAFYQSVMTRDKDYGIIPGTARRGEHRGFIFGVVRNRAARLAVQEAGLAPRGVVR